MIGVGLLLSLPGNPEPPPDAVQAGSAAASLVTPADPAEQAEPSDIYERCDWAQEVYLRPRGAVLTEDEEERLRRYVLDGSSRVRRAAVLALSQYGKRIAPDTLLGLLDLPETLDIPLGTPSEPVSSIEEALKSNRTATVRMVVRTIWLQTCREHAFPYIDRIEGFSRDPDPEVRKSAYRALGEITKYVPNPKMVERIQDDAERVRWAARKLLKKTQPGEFD